jgi:hypothetical protein
MNIFEEFPKIISAFEDEDLRYALVGGVAMAFHDEPRFTKDIDILLIPEDIAKLKKILSAKGYVESTTPWTFKNVDITLHRFLKIEEKEHLQLDVLTANEKRSKQIIKNALEAESEQGIVRVATKKDLIWMKKQRDSDQDKVDIKKLEDDKNEENR